MNLSENEKIAQAITLLRAKSPLVQVITNFVSMDIAANVLLAAGASPAMVHAVEETPEFLPRAGALTINTGTLSAPWAQAMLVAAELAHQLGKPWVLDPVGAGGTSFRNGTLASLLVHRPTLIRANASEIMALAHIAGLSRLVAQPRGVDSAHQTFEAQESAIALARHLHCCVVATGAMDVITNGQQTLRLGNGHPLMTRVTALGCALSALCAAFAAVIPDAMEASMAAVGAYGVAGEIGAEIAKGPGSFRVAFVDALANLTPADIAARLKIEAA